MKQKHKKLNFCIIASKNFWFGAPMLISEIIKRGHYFSVFDENMIPTIKKILDCDVFIDMSTITQNRFYTSLSNEIKNRKKLKLKIPLMIDPPDAIMNSYNKENTHKIFPDLIPESYFLTGVGNVEKINKFKKDKYLVIKNPIGWWGKGVERVTISNAIKKYKISKGIIIQKYLSDSKGVGRIITIRNRKSFEILSSYLKVPILWKTGFDNKHKYKCVSKPTNKALRDFAISVSSRCGLYLNGIDYIYSRGKYFLLETNSVPSIKEPYDNFGVDISKKIIDNIEKAVT